jgi:septum formation protein
MYKLILATSSQHRIKAFQSLGIEFTAESSDVDEYTSERPKEAMQLTKYLAKKKARTVAENHPEDIVLGFDTVGTFSLRILEKPKSRQEAYERLKLLSGNELIHHTGVHLISPKTEFSRSVFSFVQVRSLSDEEINRYLDQGEGFKTPATGFDPSRFYSSTFIKKINGSPTNVMSGIPLEKVVEMLKQAEYKF